jgi:ubiquinone/menaquinone biosynthesis C-methylase UbiE
MGIWNDKLLPRLIDRGMRNEFMAEHRNRAAPLARGRVLEVGFGSGLNVPLYTSSVEHLFGLEPSDLLCEKAQELASEAPFPVDILTAGAESIPLDSDEIDTVVSSWTLCSIPGIEPALQEIRRVLKPSGRFVFIEHGRAPDAGVARWQDRLEPLTAPLLGCRLNRPIDTLVSGSGFELINMEKAYSDGPKLISYHYIGQARPL